MRSVQSNLFVILGRKRYVWILELSAKGYLLIKDVQELEALASSDIISALIALRKRI
jgi:hypothetical protein